MIVIGLTGSIAMGKSTVSKMLQRHHHIPVWDADETVHHLFRTSENLRDEIDQHFPGCVKDSAVDRGNLREIVFHDSKKLRLLESLIHPKIAEDCHAFIKKNSVSKACVLDIPLLFEINWDEWCDTTIVVSAPQFLQKLRLLRRPGIEKKTMDSILKQQWSDRDKCLAADFVIKTGLTKGYTFYQLKKIMTEILG